MNLFSAFSSAESRIFCEIIRRQQFIHFWNTLQFISSRSTKLYASQLPGTYFSLVLRAGKRLSLLSTNIPQFIEPVKLIGYLLSWREGFT